MGGKYPRNVAVRSRAVNQPELKWIFTSLGSYICGTSLTVQLKKCTSHCLNSRFRPLAEFAAWAPVYMCSACAVRTVPNVLNNRTLCVPWVSLSRWLVSFVHCIRWLVGSHGAEQ